ncbi:MAG: Cys-tRNA(Pro) deacylase, partial [Chloroflexi bacterium]|nr:Cys-tRNA(Pro) deacylase [Chloroflexota bacterium]
MAKARKLNVMRLLDARGIAYTAHYYDPALRDARGVAVAV